MSKWNKPPPRKTVDVIQSERQAWTAAGVVAFTLAGFLTGAFIFTLLFRRYYFVLGGGVLMLADWAFIVHEWNQFPNRHFLAIAFAVGFAISVAVFGREDV